MMAISLSLVSLSFIAFSILQDKRIRGHPNNIIAMICLCDAYTYCQFLIRYFICGYEMNEFLEELFSWTAMIPYWTVSVKWANMYHETQCGARLTWEYLE